MKNCLITIIIIYFLSFINLFSQNICYVMSNFIRPYKELTDILNKNFKNTTFIVKAKNFWKIKSCNTVISFGEDTANLVRNKYYSNKKEYAYTFIGFKNSCKKLKKNEQVYFLQPEPDYIFENVKNVIPFANKWLVFYSKDLQKEYIETAIKFSAYYNIEINPVYASKKVNLNKIIEKRDYNLFWFIPDPVYSSTYLISFILEKLIFLKKFSVGFNEFFYNSGATVSFKIDYKKTAELINKNLNSFKSGYFQFKYKILINKKNLRFLKSEFNKKD